MTRSASRVVAVTLLVVLTIGSTLGGASTPDPGQPPLKPPSRQTPRDSLAEPIHEVSLERLCFGCESYRITFRDNGSATWLTIGVARAGTIDQTRTGTLSREDFSALGDLIRRHDFLGLKDSYSDPRVVDGSTMTTTVLFGTRRKSVAHSNHAGPGSLKLIEEAIDVLSRKTAWAQPITEK